MPRSASALPEPDPTVLTAEAEALERPSASRLLVRLGLLGLTLVSLYLLLPSLVGVLSQWDQLDRIHPVWLALIVAAQVGSFACVWGLQRLALRTTRWFAVATSQLAGNAFSRIVPGGAAAGVALQLRMLSDAGVRTGAAATALTAVSLLTTAVVVSLPVLALPAIVGGTPVDAQLAAAAWFGAAVFVLMVGIGATLLLADRPLVAVGRAVGWVREQSPRRRRRREGAPDDPLAAGRRRRALIDRLIEERDLIRDTLQARWGAALVLAAGRSLLDYLALLAALVAVGADANPSLVLLAYVAAMVLSMIPVTPGGLGFVEAGLTATLTVAGVSAQQAVVATLAYRLASYWLPLPAGAAGAWAFRRRYRKTVAPLTP